MFQASPAPSLFLALTCFLLSFRRPSAKISHLSTPETPRRVALGREALALLVFLGASCSRKRHSKGTIGFAGLRPAHSPKIAPLAPHLRNPPPPVARIILPQSADVRSSSSSACTGTTAMCRPAISSLVDGPHSTR